MIQVSSKVDQALKEFIGPIPYQYPDYYMHVAGGVISVAMYIYGTIASFQNLLCILYINYK